MRATDDEAEEPAAGHGGQPRVAGRRELVDDGGSVRRPVGEHPLETSGHLLEREPRRHRPLGERVEPLHGEGVGAVEAGTAVGIHLVSVRPSVLTH